LVQNLVSNAIKYTQHGRVLVGVRRRGELAEILIVDTGIGIDGDKLNTVFDEFTRLEAGKRQAEGLGLGLSIVDRIARVLRAELRIDSDPGAGTRFSVLLPVTLAEPAAVSPSAANANSMTFGLTGLKVLCIDNDPRIKDSIRKLLEGWGCSVQILSGSAGLETAERPEIALVDYHLDDETGLDVIAKARQRFGADLTAVLVTAERSGEVKAVAQLMDVTVIHKPVKPAALRSIMGRVRREAETTQ
jgi:CheY-like chemotaxis protein